MSFRDWQASVPQAPPWFLGPRGAAWLRAHGKIKDYFFDLAKVAAKVSLPSHAPDDALPEIGWERQLERGPSETEDAYRARLQNAWELWKKVGTHEGLLLEMKAQGFPTGANGAHIMQHNGLYSYLDTGDVVVFGEPMDCVNRRAADGSTYAELPGWTCKLDDQFWPQFNVLFPVDVPALRSGTSTAALLNRTVNKWKPVRHYRGAIVIESGGCLGWPLGQELGDGGVLGTDVVHFIPPTDYE